MRAVIEVPASGPVAADALLLRSAGAVRITVLLPGVDPPDAARLLETVALAQKQLEDAVSLALWLADVKALSPEVVASPSAFACAQGYVLIAATETCCTAHNLNAPPAAEVDPARVMWTNSCSWECLPPFVRYNATCLTCSNRNALVPASVVKPSNAAWDDSGASQDCTGWLCQAGFIMQADRSSCLSYSTLFEHCSVYRYLLFCS